MEVFINKLNVNSRNIILTWNISMEHIVFLDLDISKDGDRYKMINHFKPTDRNAFILLESCHHNRWLRNIPRGQCIRLRRNCTQEEDFISQSQVLSTRFQQKGYDQSILENEIEKVRNIESNTLSLNISGISQNTTTQMRMILDFNFQHKKFEKIVQRH